jgi:acyl-CoA synthetase (AMP-forming)/AMP-acid ligase II
VTPPGLRSAAPDRRGVPFAERLASFGDRPAVVTADEEITYRDLAARVGERTASLGEGRRLVLIAGGNHLETLVTYLAALAGGHVAWLVPEAYGPRAASLVCAFEPDVVVARGAGGVHVQERRSGSAHRLHPDLALLLGTSGSTGAPKLVRLSYENLRCNAEAIALSLGITASERAVTSLPMHYCYGLSVVNSHLARGAALVLTDRSVTDPAFWDLLRDRGGTSFAGVPHTFELLDRVGFPEMDLPSLRYVTQAGGRLAPETVRRYADLGARRGWRLVVMYGQTEATARMACLPPCLVAQHPDCIGLPIPGGSLEIRPVAEAEGDVGELVYRGPNVMLGYAESPEDLALGRVVHELCTGDLGRRTPEGLYQVVGRRSRFLKLFGLRIDLQEVERILEESGVQGVCAGSDERLVVAVTDGADAAAVAQLVAGRLGLPRGSVAARSVEDVPRLPSGKPDYEAVARLAGADRVERASAGAAAGSRAGAQAAVAEAFREVLGREAGAEDTFSGLGGDSLSYVEMSLALEERLGHLPRGWADMTVRELANLTRPRRRATQVETSVVLRAAAISLVVASHMTAFWPAGGAHLLLAIAGYNFARFQLSATRRRWLPASLGAIARIAVPASAWIGLWALLAGGYSLGTVLLVNNYTGAPDLSGGQWHYWFLEALVQILAVLTVLLSIGRLRRLESRHPLGAVLVLLGLALASRFVLAGLGQGETAIFRPHAVAWLFLVGWAAHRAATPAQRLMVSAAVLACTPGFFDEVARTGIVAGGALLLVWIPVLAVPRPLTRVVGAVAAASLYIYLTHWKVWPALAELLPIEIAFAATIAAGIAAWALADRATRLALRAWEAGRFGRGARRAPGPPAAPLSPRPAEAGGG